MSNQTFQQAVSHHQAGRLKEAEGLYRAVLGADPAHADANHNLGVLAIQIKQPAAALPLLKAALDANPAQHQFWVTYISAQLQTDDLDGARRTLDLARVNGLPEALAGQMRRQIEMSPAALRAAVAADPYSAEAHTNLGAGLKAQGQLDAAVQSFRRAIELKPSLAAAHSNLGNTLLALGQRQAAIDSLRQAISLNPAFAEAHNNLGIALVALGNLPEAIVAYRNAIELRAEYAEAHTNLGNALQSQGEAEQALASYSEAVRLRPDLAAAHNNLGNALMAMGRFEDAAQSFGEAVRLKPDFAVAHCNLGNVLQNLGRPAAAIGSFETALALKPDFTEAMSNLLFTRNSLADRPPAELLAQARRFGAIAAGKAQPFTAWPNPRTADRPLKVGLVSGDLRAHPVGFYIEGLTAALAARADSRLEIYAYAGHTQDDAVSTRIRANCSAWRPVFGMPDAALAAAVRDDGIDVLIDLAGHTAHNRLTMFAFKPAPVQASWLGYFATTGLEAIDYFIADPWTVPGGAEDQFSEQVWRLPRTCLCLAPPDLDIEVGPSPALANGHVTFGCFNNLTKITDRAVAAWSNILAGVPRSRLLLRSRPYADPAVIEAVRARFAAAGADPSALLVEPSTTRAAYLAAYNRVDISLDPFPYPGVTTSLESLWMGAPVLTMAGDRFLSRTGESIARNMDMADWIAADEDDYVRRAITRASDAGELAELRAGLRARALASPLFDGAAFASAFEAGIRDMWTRWLNS